MKVCFEKKMLCQGIEVKHSENTGKDYPSIKLLDTSNGEFIKINTTNSVSAIVKENTSYIVSVRAESFYNQDKNVSGYRLFCYNVREQ